MGRRSLEDCKTATAATSHNKVNDWKPLQSQSHYPSYYAYCNTSTKNPV